MSVQKLLTVTQRVCWVVFFALVITSLVTELPFSPHWVWLPAVLALAAVVELSRRARRVHAHRPPAVEVEAPVAGRWTALNSPADKVPSHGVHAYGQTYAIDIVAEPEEGRRPAFAWLWPLARPNSAFPAFGAPLLAVADATVVHASDGRRDHLSRNSLIMLVYMLLVEASVRDISGASWVVGNHVVLDLGDGTYALYAHVRRGSLSVRAGDTVRAGQQIARCGNSGNSSEPHVHFQLMDGPDLDTARGVPFTWRGIGVPRNGETFAAGSAADSSPTLSADPSPAGKTALPAQED
ncbi:MULTISPECIES: M23 family metallopeptidase [unclassified Streptomyces]|uniref:M23 family metallopeptidase n=1 Tax=unclassified Streptomyces TaxID=2593676 RepID=UPI0033303C73